jgi:hypothetical protein
MQAAGTKQRIVQRCQYNPANPRKAERPVRVTSARGTTQTYKKKGDFIITNDRAPMLTVTRAGWL